MEAGLTLELGGLTVLLTVSRLVNYVKQKLTFGLRLSLHVCKCTNMIKYFFCFAVLVTMSS